MTDADIDGNHIRTLILTLFFRYMKDIIERIFVYRPATSIFGKGKKQTYCWTEEQRKKAVTELAEGKEESVNIQRYKGLEK